MNTVKQLNSLVKAQSSFSIMFEEDCFITPHQKRFLKKESRRARRRINNVLVAEGVNDSIEQTRAEFEAFMADMALIQELENDYDSDYDYDYDYDALKPYYGRAFRELDDVYDDVGSCFSEDDYERSY
jgi:hypothetical protein